MDSITPLARTDIADVSQLFQRYFRLPAPAASCAVQPYFEQLYLNNPWQNNAIPSLVFKTGGRVAGFLGIITFPMTFHGTAIRAAISGNVILDPALPDPLAGPRVLKVFLSGPQDVSYTDITADTTIKMWKGLGGSSVHSYSLQWLRIIRPTTVRATMGTRAAASPLFAEIAKPLSFLIDTTLSVLPKAPVRPEPSELHVEEISSHDLFNAVHHFSARYTLAPTYTEESLTWLLAHAEETTEYGPLRKIALFTPEHAMQGWVLYYPNVGGTGRVLQLGVSALTAGAVLSRLFIDAGDCGTLALTGRMEPQYGAELSAQHCIFTRRNSSLAVHSNHADIMNAFHRGETFLTRREEQ